MASRSAARTAEAAAVPAGDWFTADLARVLGAASVWGSAFSTFYLLPKFLAQELGAGPSEIGLAVGIFPIATVAATPFAGWVVDRFPRRYAMVAGAAVMALAAAGFLGVRRLGPFLDALRALQGLSYALVVTAVGTLVADVVPRARLNQALGLSGASMLVMNAVAPAAAEPLAAAAGWPAVFAAASIAAATATVLAAGVREPAWARAAGARGGLRALLAQPVARHYGLVVALSGAAFGAVFTFEPAHALALGRTRVGGFFIAYACAAIAVRVGLGSLPARLGSYRVARTALALYALVVLALAGVGAGGLEPLGALFGLAHGLFYPAINAIAVAAVRRHERGRMIAVFTGAFSAGLAGGSTLLGYVAVWGGYPAVFVVAACGAAVALVLLRVSPALSAAGRAMEVG
ncbi:MAG: MFS transporter [Deltaproteobacteria bacterium]|nr:MFS transporter [Deltaproteobacteria bacterium]